jgi:hypothetical protein
MLPWSLIAALTDLMSRMKRITYASHIFLPGDRCSPPPPDRFGPPRRIVPSPQYTQIVIALGAAIASSALVFCPTQCVPETAEGRRRPRHEFPRRSENRAGFGPGPESFHALLNNLNNHLNVLRCQPDSDGCSQCDFICSPRAATAEAAIA